ncbi:MAG TPA: ABC transporter ATP-binding protein [Prolixibacteraceae bacterium]|nr:ABC transporter ATP-binding protein [Prolixibacteraceae bacterium]HOS90515.1 ABC transporter ATP-binding protein [Prolixibacteraceae bacterium]HPL45570.1 ABC transporter ATP-binding protein [Prolixibacteraceae bacterium]HQE52628.1 ABC transporter ATP-binding protein [Prolixibacteraceae bacterium]HQJ85827.1 ABC transporter ATP-binding protein [Prolixibacteraceae bacterium]
MSIAIKIENLSKQYRLGSVSTRTLSHDLNRWWQMNIRGKEDPFLKIGEISNRATKSESEFVWALRDINIEVQEGEILGIIGKNGAGKSTLLKILSKVTVPTTGSVHARGRIASLLEVGTGFHPEMTGRENVFMNGAIMGMSKAEITRKLDEIIDFAGVEQYIDTPVKRYSSGMTVRLGFAVSAHLEPEILVVDEVLAVGDAEFQKKATGKMQEISKGKGRTVLLVSHNMSTISELCKRSILLHNGIITDNDKTRNVVSRYLSVYDDLKAKNEWKNNEAPGNEFIKLRKAYIIDSENETIDHAFIDQEIGFCIEYEVINDVPFFTHGLNIYNGMEIHLFTSHDDVKFERNKIIKKGHYKTVAWIPANLLQNDTIEFSFACMRYNPFEVLFHEKKLVRLNILDKIDSDTRNKDYLESLPGLIRPKIKWDQTKEIN